MKKGEVRMKKTYNFTAHDRFSHFCILPSSFCLSS